MVTAAAPDRSAGIVRRVIGLFAPYRRRVAVLAACVLVSSVLGVANPLLTKVVFDRGLFPGGGEPRLGLLTVLVALMVGIVLVSGVLGIFQTYLTNVVGQRVMHDLRERLYAHLQRMSLRFFTATRTGEIQSRIANDVGGVGAVVTNTVSTVLSNTLFVIASFVALAVLSWQLALVSLLIVPAFVYLTVRIGRVRRRLAATTQETLAELSVITQETLSISGVLLAKVFDRQQDSFERYRDQSRRLADLRVRQEMAGRTLIGLMQTFLLITPALVYLGAGYLSAGGLTGRLTAGTVVAFTALQTRLYAPMSELMNMSIQLRSSGALFERIFHYLDFGHEIVDAPDARVLQRESVRGAIRFRHVYFRYESDARGAEEPPWTLADLDFEVAPGQLAAFVGPSGAGKTTVSYLVPRLYDVQRGAVEIDGTDVRTIALASLADVVGMVTQETYLFHATVRANLLYARPDASEAEIDAAARAALIHERILELPEGYDTVIGERGYRLSGGERQRLAIARVILKDPRILVLDEATAALDTESERLVQAALAPLMEGRTSLVIAHRLSTIVAADVIFVVDRGRLVESGTHAELVGRPDGLYARLYEQQFQSGLVEARCEDGLVLASGDVLER